jgi:predicted Zn-dependent protease with MMP-like domain
MKTIKRVTDPDIVVAPSEKDYVKAKRILRDLMETACRAIIAIEDKKPNHEICDLAIEEIENLLGEISSCILGD